MLIDNFKTNMDKFEEELRWGTEMNYLIESPSIQEGKKIFSGIQRVWTVRKPFISLMPHYPTLKTCFTELEQSWIQLINNMRKPAKNLTDQVFELGEIITEITDFYGMEPEISRK
jgi:hypothetical protein